jgi:hypothetical protein
MFFQGLTLHYSPNSPIKKILTNIPLLNLLNYFFNTLIIKAAATSTKTKVSSKLC